MQFPFTPPGVGAAGAITIDKGKNEGLYPLNANGDAMLGKWPMMVIGAAEIDGQAWVSSQLAELEIADRYVTLRCETLGVRPRAAGASSVRAHAQHAVRRQRARPSCLGLPPGATADPVEFTKDTESLLFQVKTTKETPVGSHKIAVLPGDDHAERRANRRHGRHDRAASQRAAGRRRQRRRPKRPKPADAGRSGRQAALAIGAASRQGPSPGREEAMNDVHAIKSAWLALC